MTTPNSNPKPNRRWFAFRLRTLFVVLAMVAIPLAWIGYSLNWIRQRRDILKQLEVGVATRLGFSPEPNEPGALWLFGERGTSVLIAI